MHKKKGEGNSIEISTDNLNALYEDNLTKKESLIASSDLQQKYLRVKYDTKNGLAI